MFISEEIKKLELNNKAGEDELQVITAIFIVLYLLMFLVERLPRTSRTASFQSSAQILLRQYLYFYKAGKFEAPDKAGPFGKYVFNLSGEAVEVEEGKNGFNWKRFEEMFSGYRSDTE